MQRSPVPAIAAGAASVAQQLAGPGLADFYAFQTHPPARVGLEIGDDLPDFLRLGPKPDAACGHMRFGQAAAEDQRNGQQSGQNQNKTQEDLHAFG